VQEARRVHDRPAMHAALVFNAHAGSSTSKRALVSTLDEAGWSIDEIITPAELDEGHDVVVVAGGDGTVTTVAKRLAGTSALMAIVPTGTVNNVARSLGIGVDPRSAAVGLARVVERRVDLGVVHSEGQREYFLEGFGVGVFAYFMGEKATKAHKKPRTALRFLADEMEHYQPHFHHIESEGRDLSGEYLLVAAMNMRSFGPAMPLAPEARCDDGELDLICVRPESRAAFVAHLRRAADVGDVALPAFDMVRTTSVRVRSDGRWAHVDDDARELSAEARIGIERGAVRILVPAQ
jgi:diacylglycerol kinase (ATP)